MKMLLSSIDWVVRLHFRALAFETLKAASTASGLQSHFSRETDELCVAGILSCLFFPFYSFC